MLKIDPSKPPSCFLIEKQRHLIPCFKLPIHKLQLLGLLIVWKLWVLIKFDVACRFRAIHYEAFLFFPWWGPEKNDKQQAWAHFAWSEITASHARIDSIHPQTQGNSLTQESSAVLGWRWKNNRTSGTLRGHLCVFPSSIGVHVMFQNTTS